MLTTHRTCIISLLCALAFFAIPAFSQKEPDEKRLKEKHRPQFHFSPLTKWTNDPNGLVYYQDEYHLFYQHFPDSSVWGPMHWGHAVSKDLVHWEHLPIALYPDSLGYIFSGSVVVDWKNSSGFGSGATPPLVALFTYHDPVKDSRKEQCQSQAVAYSIDKGRTWTKYKGNPVLKSPGMWAFRDPKVRWHEETNRWIMTLTGGNHIRFYSSPDLLSWSFESEFGRDAGFHGGTWECPDLLPLRVEESRETKWLLIVSIYPGGVNGASGTQYFTGDFDGKRFVADSKVSKWLDFGPDNYAGITWSDLPSRDKRQIFLGWMSNWQYADKVPTTVWRNAMTLPRSLKLKRLASDYVLHSFPVEEVMKLRRGSEDILSTLASGREMPVDSLFELELELDIPKGKKFAIVFENRKNESAVLDIGGDMVFDRTASGNVGFEKGFGAKHVAVRPSGSAVKLHVFVDVSSIEVFANEGEVVMSELVFPSVPFSSISLRYDAGVAVRKATLHKLGSIWAGGNVGVEVK